MAVPAAVPHFRDLRDAERAFVQLQKRLDTLIADLASTEAGKGSGMIGFSDPDTEYTATTVEAALAEAI